MRVKSDAPETGIRRLIDDANNASSYLHVWMDPQDLRVDLRLEEL